MSARVWQVGATHEAFGAEGVREYRGTELGAKRRAAQIARRGGHGWRPYVREQEIDVSEAEARGRTREVQS